VGHQVASSLHGAGVDVLGVDVRPAPEGVPFRYVTADVASLDTMVRLMEGRPNVVHAAAISGPMLMLDNPYGIAQANLAGAMAVFEAARRVAARRLVWMSSIAIYGNQPTLDPLTESTPANPQSFYGHTKVAGEALLKGYVTHYGLSAVALRMSSVFGVRRQTACTLRAMIEAGMQGRSISVPSEGSCFRQYLHVKDAANAVVLALSASEVPAFVYNITGGTYVTEAALAHMIGEIMPELVIEHGPIAWHEGHLGPLIIDAATRDLGYRPHVSLRAGLAELCSHIQAREAA
jgi:UDP-glucuronate 4-epimerase